MLRTILVPLDGSTRAEKILPYVEELALGRESKIILMEVIEPSAYMVGSYETMPYYSQEMAASVLKEAKAYLEHLAQKLEAKGLEATAVVKHGMVVQTILEVADEEQADLIAMASHGRSGLGRVFYGSVAAGILQQADRPLLLIRSDEPT